MTRKSVLSLFVIVILSGALVSACASQRTPADAIVDYLEALEESDQAAAVASSCTAWETEALAEGASFVNVEVELKDPDCQVQDQTDTEASVLCTGSFVFSYDAGEDQVLDLFGRVFSVVKEDGEWRMCGYKMIFD